MSGDAETLAEVIREGTKGNAWSTWSNALLAKHILASDWFAAHDAAIRAEAWDEALREVQAQAGRYGAAVSRTFLARSCERAYDALRAAQPTEDQP